MAMGAMGCKGQGWTQGSQGGASSSPLRQWLTRLVAVEVLGSGQSLDILKVELRRRTGKPDGTLLTGRSAGSGYSGYASQGSAGT